VQAVAPTLLLVSWCFRSIRHHSYDNYGCWFKFGSHLMTFRLEALWNHEMKVGWFMLVCKRWISMSGGRSRYEQLNHSWPKSPSWSMMTKRRVLGLGLEWLLTPTKHKWMEKLNPNP
jgi:hypothetical protein